MTESPQPASKRIPSKTGYILRTSIVLTTLGVGHFQGVADSARDYMPILERRLANIAFAVFLLLSIILIVRSRSPKDILLVTVCLAVIVAILFFL